MDFEKFLGRYQYTFKCDSPYINVRSIERYYSNAFGYDNSRAVFMNWLIYNKDKVSAAYMYLYNHRDREDIMISRLIQRPINSSPLVHPVIALLFSFDISPFFALSILTLFCGAVNEDISSRFIDYVNQSNADKKTLMLQRFKHNRRHKKCCGTYLLPHWIQSIFGINNDDNAHENECRLLKFA